MSAAPSVSVVFSTYNSTAWLEKTLWGFAYQTWKDFEIVVADDGSGPETRELIERMRAHVGRPVQHVWHEDRGFQKSQILNKAIAASRGDYLLFTDGDCIPRNDFVEVHAKLARPGHLLSGGYVKLPRDISKAITPDDIREGRSTNADWLRSQGMRGWRALAKLRPPGALTVILNALTTTRATWNGHNASGWKRDIVAANGFDERMQYGGQDRELGERLVNAGIKPVQIRYSAACVHLDHDRGYKTPESLAKNAAIRKHTRTARVTWTPYGIVKSPTRPQ
ncbi:MAG TPA: glycosyltransferase family 2 protein [Gemmatimonadaceae bacterium]|nr:glycosyltransferase family 2 protein [Gemmatimonadaceae bacterium]